MSENMEQFPNPAEGQRIEESQQIHKLLLTATNLGKGPYDASTFLAGAQIGIIISALGTLRAAGGTVTVANPLPYDLVELADLIGMHFGFRALRHDPGDSVPAGDHAWIKFHNEPMLGYADEED